jgi:hypothetical protein
VPRIFLFHYPVNVDRQEIIHASKKPRNSSHDTTFLSEKYGKYGKITPKINILVMVIRIWLTQTNDERVECITASNDAAQELRRIANVM